MCSCYSVSYPDREKGGAIQVKNCCGRDGDFAKWMILRGEVGIGSVEILFQPRTVQIELEHKHKGEKVGRTAGRMVNTSPF